MPKGYFTRKLKPIKERFESKVSMEPMTGCWLWVGAYERHGYAKIGVRKEKNHWGTKKGSHVSWELYFGPVPEGFNLCHYCDTPECVSPYHLFLGTSSDNQQDSSRKDRRRAKLLVAQVLQIRNDLRPTFILAEQYKVSYSTIQAIRSGKTWAHI